MTLLGAANDLLDRPPEWLPDGAALCLVHPDQGVVQQVGGDLPADVCWDDGGRPGLAAGVPWTHAEAQLSSDGSWLLAAWPAAAAAVDARMVQCLLQAWSIVDRVEHDLDNTIAHSTGLLEEVATLNDTLPRLGAQDGEGELAALCIENLLIATDTTQGVYVGISQATGEAGVQAWFRHEGGRFVDLLADGPAMDWQVDPTAGLLGAALQSGKAVIRTRRDFGAERSPAEAPEWLAERNAMAVPVVADLGGGSQTLGLIVVMDKRAGPLHPNPDLDSREASLTSGVASVLAAFLGARRNAESRKEIALAKEIQDQILPDQAARVAGFELAGNSTAHGSMGGDYYDYLRLGDGRTLVAIADVSGHNLASGVVMISARAALRALAAGANSPADVFGALGSTLHKDLSDLERFVTAAAVAIQPGSREMELVNAGHNPIMWFHQTTGEVEELEAEDPIFGFMPGMSYESRSFAGEPGDIVLLYTDGVTEATGRDEEMFGEARLAKVLAESAALPAPGILEAILASVDRFADTRGAGGDDVTVVVIKLV